MGQQSRAIPETGVQIDVVRATLVGQMQIPAVVVFTHDHLERASGLALGDRFLDDAEEQARERRIGAQLVERVVLHVPEHEGPLGIPSYHVDDSLVVAALDARGGVEGCVDLVEFGAGILLFLDMDRCVAGSLPLLAVFLECLEQGFDDEDAFQLDR
ncbi:MAG TPA: hypothetical protein PLQ29_08680 [Spirochaetales bacterium]|nr:hypothetical protein [Spirochaetales bacterium]